MSNVYFSVIYLLGTWDVGSETPRIGGADLGHWILDHMKRAQRKKYQEEK